MVNALSAFVHNPESGVTIVNELGGAGMTLSFGLAEEVLNLFATQPAATNIVTE